RVCLRLPAYSASAKDICFIGAQPFSSWDSRISPDLEVFFRVSLASSLDNEVRADSINAISSLLERQRRSGGLKL
ncbi:hypothetical protein, partial [Pseudomonas gessardii]|uniref:hypothetical protein n=2 Tax=Pseudomonas gessardii TaxID=78544 RepID=UPI001CA3EE42